SRSLMSKWSANLKKEFAKRYKGNGWEIESEKYLVGVVRAKTLNCHPLLAQWGKPSTKVPWSFGHLMLSESRVIISTMLRLAREHNIPAAPVYDSVIVPRTKALVAEQVLDEQFTAIIGVKPKLKVRPFSALDF